MTAYVPSLSEEIEKAIEWAAKDTGMHPDEVAGDVAESIILGSEWERTREEQLEEADHYGVPTRVRAALRQMDEARAAAARRQDPEFRERRAERIAALRNERRMRTTKEEGR